MLSLAWNPWRTARAWRLSALHDRCTIYADKPTGRAAACIEICAAEDKDRSERQAFCRPSCNA